MNLVRLHNDGKQVDDSYHWQELAQQKSPAASADGSFTHWYVAHHDESALVAARSHLFHHYLITSETSRSLSAWSDEPLHKIDPRFLTSLFLGSIRINFF